MRHNFNSYQHCKKGTTHRHGVNSIVKLMGNSNSGIVYKKQGIEIDKFGIGVCYKKINPQINFFNS